jgi:hypothetical protein
MGKKLEAQSVSEWANVVKWLYNQIEPTYLADTSSEPEIIVRVTREETAFKALTPRGEDAKRQGEE